MNLGSSAADIGLIVLLLFPALLAPILLIGIGVLLARALRLSAVFAVFFALSAIGALLVGGSLYLDSAGRSVPGIVDSHTEVVQLRPQGDWRHRLHVSVRYRLDGGVLLADQPAPAESATTLRLTPAQFDSLREGGPAQLRVLPLFRSLALVRLTGSSTIDYIPWTWVGGSLGVLLLLWLSRRLVASTVGGVVLVVAVLVGAVAVPSALGYRQWLASEDLASKPLRATAQVREVTRITQIDLFPCTPGARSRCSRRNSTFDVAQPYDIVEMRFVPQGAAGEVIALDAVDAGATSVAPGASIEIAYAPAAARAAQILGASHSHHWHNILGFVVLTGATALLAVAVLWGIFWLIGRSRQRRNAATP